MSNLECILSNERLVPFAALSQFLSLHLMGHAILLVVSPRRPCQDVFWKKIPSGVRVLLTSQTPSFLSLAEHSHPVKNFSAGYSWACWQHRSVNVRCLSHIEFHCR